jgi:hypothetical protein
MFVASLVWNDHSLRIYVESQQRLTERKIAEVSYVISLTEFQAKVLRAAKPDRA